MSDTTFRAHSPTELAAMVRAFREAWRWDQETLADQSGLTVRTVQRVEAGEPSSVQTRRSLARAFRMPDIDVFNKPTEFQSPEAAARAKAEFDRDFVMLEVKPVTGRPLMKAVTESGPFRLLCFGSVGALPRAAEDAFATISDYLRDVLEVLDLCSATELLVYGDEMDLMATGMKTVGFEVGFAVRKVAIGSTRIPAEVTYILAVPVGGGPRQVAVRREMESAI